MLCRASTAFCRMAIRCVPFSQSVQLLCSATASVNGTGSRISGGIILSTLSYVFPQCPHHARALTLAIWIFISHHVASTSVFIACVLIHFPWILILISLQRLWVSILMDALVTCTSSHDSWISVSDSAQKLWIHWSADSRMPLCWWFPFIQTKCLWLSSPPGQPSLCFHFILIGLYLGLYLFLAWQKTFIIWSFSTVQQSNNAVPFLTPVSTG